MSEHVPTSEPDMPAEHNPPAGASADDPEETALLDDLRVVMDRREAMSAFADAAASLEGRRVGQYLVGRLLGEGGMARVYRAVDTELERDVAFKVLKPPYHADHQLCARFEREARTMAGIDHPNVVGILGFPRSEGIRAIVMELLTGGSLRQRMDTMRSQGWRMSVPEVVALVGHAADGVHAAHRIGVVHRDLKPSNLLLAEDGTVKVADFGAILVLEGTTWLTGVGQQIGTPGYMSPEQCTGDRITPASDVYSLAATLFELVAGRLPFEVTEASPFALMLKHISAPVPDPRIWREDVPDWLVSVILKGLEKRPADRFQHAGELAEALKAGPPAPLTQPDEPAEPGAELVDLAAVREQLKQLPQRAIVCWACRCARRVQRLNDDPRVAKALEMAESTITGEHDEDAGHSLSRALARIRSLRAASLRAAYPGEEGDVSSAAAEAARAAAAAASAAAARCIDDAAADAAFVSRSAVTALARAGESIKTFWNAARDDFHILERADLGEAGTVGKPIPPSIFKTL